MSDQNWRPINAEDDGCAVLITYRNEAGEEHVHVADSWCVDLDSSILHTLCWRQCSGDWPGCKANCPLFTGPVTEWVEEQKRYETMPPHDPFSFMLNHYCSIDDNNCYVEEFDTLDGAHWEIAVDVADHLLDMLDEETKDE